MKDRAEITAARSSEADVVIVGAGVAGTAAACALDRLGLRIVLADPVDPMPPRFRAEKIEPDQAALLRKLGLLEGLLPWTARIHRVDEARAGKFLLSVELEQYGIFYHDMVNQLRRSIPADVDVRKLKVVEVAEDRDRRRVRLSDGSEIRARLVVLACGTSRNAQNALKLTRRDISRPHSMAFGFTLSQASPKRYGAEALTYFGDRIESGIDAISLFPIQQILRANLFTYWPPRDPRVQAFAAEPLAELNRLLPGLAGLAGDLELASKVQLFPIDLDVVEGHRQPGLVVIGDSFQSVCPATGTGLSKALTDVDCLATHLPVWLDSPGMAADKIESFYRDPRKTACDRNSLEMALRMRKTAIDPGLRWQLQRTARGLKNSVRAWHARFNPNGHLARVP